MESLRVWRRPPSSRSQRYWIPAASSAGSRFSCANCGLWRDLGTVRMSASIRTPLSRRMDRNVSIGSVEWPMVSISRGCSPTQAKTGLEWATHWRERPVLSHRVLQDLLAHLIVALFLGFRGGQRDGKHVLDAAGVVESYAVDLVGRQVLVHVLTILRRQNYVFDAS